MPRGENSATRRPAKRIKKIHEGIAPRRTAPLSTAQRRDAANRARTGRKVTYRVVRANHASSFDVDRRSARTLERRKSTKGGKLGTVIVTVGGHFRMFPLSRDIGELFKLAGSTAMYASFLP